MIKDLSMVEHSATSLYIEILPKIEELKTSTLMNDERLETATNLIVQTLCKSRIENGGSISQDYIIRVRRNLLKCRTIDDIIKCVNTSIQNGKNYVEKGTD